MNIKGAKVYSSLVLSMLCWSLPFIWVKIVYEYLGPISTVVSRLVLSAILLLSLGFVIKKLDSVRKEDIKYFLLLALFEPFLYFMGESFGMKYVSATVASVIVSTIPLFTPILAYYFFKQKLSKTNTIGMLVSFAGVAMVLLTEDFKLVAAPRGVLLMFVAVFSALGYSMLISKLSDKYNSISLVAYQNALGIIYFLPFFFFFEWKDFIQVSWNSELIISLLELAVFGSSLSFLLFTYAIRSVGISKANAFTNAIPVFTAVFAYFMLGERLSQMNQIGIVVVVSGLFLSQIDGLKKFRFKRVRPHE